MVEIKYTAEIPVPLDYDLRGSNNWFNRYLKVVDYLKANGKIVQQSQSSPYDWRDGFCSYDEETAYLIKGIDGKVVLKETVSYDSDSRQGSLADARLIISGANKESIDDLIGEINLLLKHS